MIKGNDVSRWNIYYSGVNAAKYGSKFVIIRAGFGKGEKDLLAENHYATAIGNGLKVGFYWFSYAKSVKDAEKEADYLIDFVADKKVEYPLIWDYEYDSRRLYYASNQLINKMARAFCRRIESAGYYAMIYANKDYYFNVFDDTIKRDFAFWYARYKDDGYLDIPKCQMWQYTNQEKIGSEKYDGDYDLVDLPSIIRKAGLNHLDG